MFYRLADNAYLNLHFVMRVDPFSGNPGTDQEIYMSDGKKQVVTAEDHANITALVHEMYMAMMEPFGGP